MNTGPLKVIPQKHPQRGLVFPPEDSSNQREEKQEQKRKQITDRERITRHLMRLPSQLGDSNQILFFPN